MIGFRRKTKTAPTTAVVAVHKGASSFLADDFAGAVKQALPRLQVVRYGSQILRGATPADLVVPRRGSLIVRLYPDDLDSVVVEGAENGNLDELKVVLIHRDPRDAAVSLYYSAAYSHSLAVPDAERFLAMRERLQTGSLAEGVEACSQPAITEFLAIRDLRHRYPEAMVTSYEEMVTDYSAWLRRFGQHLDWTNETLEQVALLTGEPFVPPAEVDANQHKRRVTPGNWQEVFDDRLRKVFEDQCGAEMSEAGYRW